ncbi:ATP-dependent zinc metalloprotease FtsH, partial [Pseudomonas aeruginosa]
VESEKEKHNTAYHDAGLAIAHSLLPDHAADYNVSILPRGRTLGMSMFLPEEHLYRLHERVLERQISSLFSGRIADDMTPGYEG